MEERVKLTSSCKDCDSIPKVKDAGRIIYENDSKLQLMFNGIKIYYESYHSPWMNQIISNLKGHHEPQEELVFYQLVKLLNDDSNMLELGCAWAYYSMFFKSMTGNGINVCLEPNPEKLKKGIANVQLNNFNMDKFRFFNGFIGEKYLEDTVFVDWDKTTFDIPQYSIEKLVSDANIFFDIVHSDIQGAELDMLTSAIPVLDQIGFFVLSTHGNKHEKCLDFLEKHKFSVLVQHSIEESVSADGLILAVNNTHTSKYEKNISSSLVDYFQRNCKITKHGATVSTTLSE